MGDATSTKPSGFVSAYTLLDLLKNTTLLATTLFPLVSVTLCCPGAHTFLTIALCTLLASLLSFFLCPTTRYSQGSHL